MYPAYCQPFPEALQFCPCHLRPGRPPATLSCGTVVDAAHILQFATSRNNDLTNGIALSMFLSLTPV